jgi:hypothetical protein
MKIIIYLVLLFLISIGSSCSTDNSPYESDSENNLEEEYEEIENENLFEDGTHYATVEYYNPETDYSNTYDLEVEVEDNQVTVIYFPNDGYLDDDHIWPAEIDEQGYAYVEGENGKTYEVYIEQ